MPVTVPPSVPVVPFDSSDQAMRFHDVDVFEEVQEAGGIGWTEAAGGMWVVARFDLIKLIAGDERFRSGEGVRFPRSGAPFVAALEYDRPVHTKHRKLMIGAVGPRPVRALEPMVRRHARALLAGWGGDRTVDLGRDYAFPLPLDVIFSIVGAPSELKERANDLAEAVFLYRTPMPDGSDPDVGIRDMLDGLIADKLAHPADDWLSRVLAHREVDGEPLTDAEVRGAVLAFLAGGHHSTSRAIACLLVEILRDPELQRRLRADPSLIPPVAEESLRVNTPLRWFARTASEDVEVEGHRIRAGDKVYLMYAAGNIDPAAFTDPRTFDPAGRKAHEHLAFGWGLHRCVGMPLAQLELRVAVEELLAATDDVRPAGEVEWTSLVEPRHVPVRLAGFSAPDPGC